MKKKTNSLTQWLSYVKELFRFLLPNTLCSFFFTGIQFKHTRQLLNGGNNDPTKLCATEKMKN